MGGSAPTSTLTIDLAAIVRRRRPERRLGQLRPRAAEDLVSVEAFVGAAGRAALVPDTTVYVHQAAGRLPPAARTITEAALMSHCGVCLGELAVGLANRNVTATDWPATRDHFEELFARIPSTRLLVPDAEAWADAGLIAGTLARVQKSQPHQRKECLNDALIFLTGAKAGLPILTANRGQFDLIQHLSPEGRFIYYQTL